MTMGKSEDGSPTLSATTTRQDGSKTETELKNGNITSHPVSPNETEGKKE